MASARSALASARRQAITLKIGIPERHQHFRRQRVDLLGSRQLLERRSLLVSREEQPPLQHRCLPAIGVDAQGRFINVVDHVIEPVGKLFAAGTGAIVTLGGLPDQDQ